MAAAACLVGMVWMGADRIVLKSRLEAAQREAASLRGQVFEAARARSQAERKAASLQQTVEQLRAGSADAGRAGFRIASLERDLQYQVRQAAEYRSMLQVLESRSMRQLELKVVDPAGGKATARAMWSADGGLLFLAHDLPDLGKEKCYQLWVLRRKEPAVLSAGLVSLDAKGNGLLYVPPDPGMELVNGFAITDEPKGGSVVARGKKLLVGVE
jgi:hypothetical protein